MILVQLILNTGHTVILPRLFYIQKTLATLILCECWSFRTTRSPPQQPPRPACRVRMCCNEFMVNESLLFDRRRDKDHYMRVYMYMATVFKSTQFLREHLCWRDRRWSTDRSRDLFKCIWTFLLYRPRPIRMKQGLAHTEYRFGYTAKMCLLEE